MVDPVLALTIGLALSLSLIVLFWPRIGIVARIKKSRENNYRILLEDTLKHLYHCEIRKQACTLQSIAGAISISSDKATKLIEKLESLNLVKTTPTGFKLTAEGRSEALRIIRSHRLWERHLADETGVSEKEWHAEAEIWEHKLTEAEANALAAQMGNPAYDPHGDPIPSSSGEIPPTKGSSLIDLSEGQFGRIVHIEDEPETIYAQLVAEGLYPGMHVQMLASEKDRIRFVVDGEEKILAPVFAANVTVVPLVEEQPMEGPFATLASLQEGDEGQVIGISKAIREQQRRRLMDLGVVPGTTISMEMRSAGGDPIAYEIKGAIIALRKEQANMIFIKKDGAN
jgi:DtxR family Mn-dependent transcriptional regulator